MNASSSMKKLAIITTHPIQYNAPFFKLLSQRGKVNCKIFYTLGKTDSAIYDSGFQRHIEWDIPLLEGYDYHFTRNISKNPSTKNFTGIVNPDLMNEIKEYNPDYLLVYGWNFKSHLAVMSHFKGKIPILFRGDSTLLDSQPFPKNLIRKLVLSRIYKRINAALYTGTNNKAYFLKHGLKPKQLIYAPHAIDNERFYIQSKNELNEAMNWRNEIGIPSQSILFLFAGKWELKKNPLLLMQAFIEQNFEEKAALLMVGQGHLETEIKELAQKHTNIYTLPFQNQSKMPLLYGMANVFVLPSAGPGETWGLAMNEAMACGLAIIASNKTGGAIDLVKDGINGYIFDAHNKDALGQILVKMTNREIVKQMGLNSKILIKSFTFEHICSAIETYILEK